MNNFKKALFLTLFIATLSLLSCENEPTDMEPAQNSTGDYWPTAVDNQWVLNQNGSDITMKIISSENTNGGTYYKFNQMAGMNESLSADASVWLKKNKGDYYIKMDDITIDLGEIKGVMTGYEFIILKDYLDVNETWSGTYSQTTTYNLEGVPAIKTTINYKGTILEKGNSLVVNGTTYTNVIKFRIHQEVTMMDQPANSVDADYWVSKNVGIIKMSSGGSDTQLVSYIVK